MGRVLIILQILVCSAVVVWAKGYKNHTVGGSLGWYDKLEQPKVDYQKWAESSNFSLGDFLIFNTDRNHSVIQTYNITTYKNCNYDEAEDDDTAQWSVSSPTVDNVPVTVEVPLVKEGPNYFFSSNYDGEQCLNGQRFNITVLHGEGLPKDLVPDPPSGGGGGDDNSIPQDGSQFDFSHPGDMEAAKTPSGTAEPMSVGTMLNLAWILWGLHVLPW